MYSTTVIDESHWLARGNPNIPEQNRAGDSELRDGNGLQCCLGFECTQCGIDPSDIFGVGMPASLSDHLQSRISHLIDEGCVNSQFCQNAARLNDDIDMKYAAKKTALIKLWRSQGWKLIFVKTEAALRRKIKELKATGE